MNNLKYISHTKAILQQHLEYRSFFFGGGGGKTNGVQCVCMEQTQLIYI